MTVTELLQQVMPRLASKPADATSMLTFVDAAQAVSDMITRRLWKRRSDLLKTAWTSANLDADTDVCSVSLPSGFLGFVEHPYISGYSDYLLPLPENSRQIYTDKGHPVYYEITGTTLTLYPPPIIDVVLKGIYFASPTALTALSGTIPFGGLFDSVFRDAVIPVANKGIYLAADPVFEAAVNTHVDGILSLRGHRTPKWVYPA